MISHVDKFVLSDSKFLTYFLPKRLKEKNIIVATTLFFNKKNLEFEISGFNIINVEESLRFLSSLENRFCLYEDTPFFEQQEFSLCINKLDSLTKNTLIAKEHKKSNKVSSIFSFIREKEKKMFATGTFLIKSRLLDLKKGGFVSSYLNSPAYINRSSFFFKFSKQKSYKSWFSLNLGYYGFLSYFKLLYFKKHVISQSSQQGFFSSRVKFYYLRNEGIKCFFLLTKPKDFLNNRFSKI
uniref:Uncharacterized protein n=1 Tax=Trachydiscus minutus TaxID=1032745 RepID=A0A140F2Q6_9STRA|nr:hypothetical protein [Trachydiscus minutus]AML60690.1 hypothetical protein [Trachydiscus minutus]